MAGTTPLNGAVRVAAADAEAAKRALLRAGVFDRTAKPVPEAGGVVFRVTDVARALAAVPGAAPVAAPETLPHVPLREREPRARVLRALADAGWDAEALESVPRKWEKLGDVVLLRVPDALAPREGELARAVADALGAKAVLAEEGGVAGEFREMARTRFLLGEDAEAVHVENGVRFKLDASRLMFSSGNVEERRRAATFPAAGETVVDLFAGIGYFTLPVAVHAAPRRVIACEKNPLAFRYLVENVTLNGVADVVEPRLGDNRQVAPEGVADRVLMGYVTRTAEFLDKAFRVLKPEGGVLHYHDTAPADFWAEELARRVADGAARAGRRVRVEEEVLVKSYSPGMVHAVLDVRVL